MGVPTMRGLLRAQANHDGITLVLRARTTRSAHLFLHACLFCRVIWVNRQALCLKGGSAAALPAAALPARLPEGLGSDGQKAMECD